MAEAAVDPARYFCHGCSRHFIQNSTDLICPHCESGFVEEVQHDASLDSDVDVEEYHNGASALEMLGGSFMNYVPGATDPTGPRQGFEADPENPISFFSFNIRPHLDASQGTSNSTPQQSGTASTSSGSQQPQAGRYNFRIRRTLNPQNNQIASGVTDPMSPDFLLEGFLQQLLSGADPGGMLGGGTAIFNATGEGSPLGMFSLHGNPGDYAWGANGLDDIITRLLGQLDSAGAPPATQSAIQRLPTININKQHVESHADCSVCMECFAVDDKAKRLPCEHMFHIKCIDQWLKLHNTCPICRKNVESNNPASCPGSTNRNSHSASGPSTGGY